MIPIVLTVGCCLCDEVTLSDFIPPIEILGIANEEADASYLDIPIRFKLDFLAPSLKPVTGSTGICAPTINPTISYKEALKRKIQYDIIWVPAGARPDMVTGADRTDPVVVDFVRAQAPKAQYILSVCGGTIPLASAGILSGKRATTNKAFFKLIKAMTPKDINWVAKARWVIDGNIWTSSGVFAGSDMALDFVQHLMGPQIARSVRGLVEIPETSHRDDPFASIHGLL